jgi:cytochrome c-type biogenesis protein CcmE
MKPKHQRLFFVSVSIVFLCLAVLLVLQAFRENIVFFYMPSELSAITPLPIELIRVGGLVEMGSVTRDNGMLSFHLTDGSVSLSVEYTGATPGLFREGQGAVVEGYLTDATHLQAKRVLTKHDEYYMPQEVVDALKKSGRWQGGKLVP